MIKIKYFLTVLIFAITQKFCVAQAQINPDNTLEKESSTIRSIDDLRDVIEGGSVQGENLFHSFQEFSIPEGTSINFANPEGIANIFSRVTGNSISEILGDLGVDGAANLFLINPNGIVFGENAAINVNGSFLATTAETIDFNNGEQFSAVDPDKVILTISFPIGLGFGSDSKDIRVKGSGNQLEISNFSDIPSALESPVVNPTVVEPGLNLFSKQTLALIGNKITLDGGVVAVPSGSIEIASVESGTVKIDSSSNKLTFDYSKVSKFQDIILDNFSLLDTSGSKGGDIRVQGTNLFISENSLILNSNLGEEPSGNINVDVEGSIDITGVNIPSNFLKVTSPGILSQSLDKGKGADINISANEINLRDFSLITSKAFSVGNAGNININVDNKITILGNSPIPGTPLASSIRSSSLASGNAGDINLSGKDLILNEGGLVLSQSIENKGGDIEVIFSDNVSISGSFPLDSSGSFLPSSLGSTTTFGTGGNVIINTANLNITEGARITATTTVGGKAGDILINATESINIEGRIRDSGEDNFFNVSQITASSEITNPSLQELFNLSNLPTGDSGSIILKTKQLSIQNEGAITVINQGTGDAGNIEINADSISLDNATQLSASTFAGEGGNIILNTENLELLTQSQITASAGGSGNGGNVTINSDSILGIENSDITANAIGGNGGDITINSDAILGLEERSQLTPFGDITATSEFGVDGTVTINSPDIDFENEVFSAIIPSTPRKELRSLRRKCLNPRRREGKLLYIGRGGVPENPSTFFDDEEIIAIDEVSDKYEQKDEEPQVWKEGDPIIEPNSVVTATNGDVYLVAETRLDSKNTQANVCEVKIEEE